MFAWLGLTRNRAKIPEYRALRAVPSRGLPAALAALESTEAHRARIDTIRQELLSEPQRPADDQPLLTTLVVPRRGGVLTMPLPDGSQCLPMFSTAVRAADYARTILSRGPTVEHLRSSPAQCARMLSDLRESGITSVTLDRCPRCMVSMTYRTTSLDSAERIVTMWSIQKASEIARVELYAGFASEAASAGRFDVARDVALEAVGHVTLEDPRLHELLRRLAVSLGDRALLRDAEAFLAFLNVATEQEQRPAPSSASGA